jgi:hypothetical protein
MDKKGNVFFKPFQKNKPQGEKVPPLRSAPQMTWRESTNAMAAPFERVDWLSCYRLALSLQLLVVNAMLGELAQDEATKMLQQWMETVCDYTRFSSRDISTFVKTEQTCGVVWKSLKSTVTDRHECSLTVTVDTARGTAFFSTVMHDNMRSFYLEGQTGQHVQSIMNVELILTTLSDLIRVETTTSEK